MPTYEELYARYRWDVPDRFNMAEACCDRHARAIPNAPAMIVDDDRGQRTYSFLQLQNMANKCANVLKALGVQPGQRVGIHLPQCIEVPVIHFGIQKIGAIALPMFTLFGPDALRYRLDNAGVSVLITSDIGIDRAGEAMQGHDALTHVLSIHGARAGGIKDFWGLMDQASDTAKTLDTGAEDPALMLYTSGTTGNPKGVLHAQRTLIGHMPGVEFPHDFYPQEGDLMWTPADWAWAGGLYDVLLPALFHGRPVLTNGGAKFEPEASFDLMARHNVRNALIMPTALRMMRQVQGARERHGAPLRTLFTGGEKLGDDLMDWGRDELGVTISEGFGQTEINLVVGNIPSVFPVRPGSMGRPIPGHRVEVVDIDGNVLVPGEEGIVAVHRPDPVMFLEYWKRPGVTAEKFRGDWCLMGDVATRDEEGYFWFKGRDDDIISSAGYRIGPTEVEDSLLTHPAVQLAGVIGAPDPVRGEAVTAYLVINQGHAPDAALATAIRNHVRERLSTHEYPRRIRFIDEMPLTVTGKIRRMDLRKMEEERTA